MPKVFGTPPSEDSTELKACVLSSLVEISISPSRATTDSQIFLVVVMFGHF